MSGFDAARAAVDHAKDGEPVSAELRPTARICPLGGQRFSAVITDYFTATSALLKSEYSSTTFSRILVSMTRISISTAFLFGR
jgi:hypothetical protein